MYAGSWPTSVGSVVGGPGEGIRQVWAGALALLVALSCSIRMPEIIMSAPPGRAVRMLWEAPSPELPPGKRILVTGGHDDRFAGECGPGVLLRGCCRPSKDGQDRALTERRMFLAWASAAEQGAPSRLTQGGCGELRLFVPDWLVTWTKQSGTG